MKTKKGLTVSLALVLILFATTAIPQANAESQKKNLEPLYNNPFSVTWSIFTPTPPIVLPIVQWLFYGHSQYPWLFSPIFCNIIPNSKP
ncbi:MAG: hypothetical protein V1753_09205 [Pseudomonadota bacterium]